MTFADTVLRLVRAGARIDTWTGPNSPHPAEETGADATGQVTVEDAFSAAFPAPFDTLDEGHPIEPAEAAEAAEVAGDLHRFEPGLSDLEAAVGLVSSGLAKRVVLSGFPSWPGLLWRAYQLADTADVLILPTLVRPGGKVDIVITREIAADG